MLDHVLAHDFLGIVGTRIIVAAFHIGNDPFEDRINRPRAGARHWGVGEFEAATVFDPILEIGLLGLFELLIRDIHGNAFLLTELAHHGHIVVGTDWIPGDKGAFFQGEIFIGYSQGLIYH